MKFRLGSRGSALALAQVKLLQAAFHQRFPEDELELVVVKTTGDMKQETPEASVSDKREWIHELEEGVVSGELDLALHSGKDVPCDIHPLTCLQPVLERASPTDLFIGRKLENGSRLSFEALPRGGVVGTASLRRRAQLHRLRKDLKVIELRGNVPTRLRKLDEGQADGLILAAAGVERLGVLDGESVERFVPAQMLPAVNQGMLCVQLLATNISLLDMLKKLVSEEASACFFAERRVAEILEGDCHSAVAIHAQCDSERLRLQAEVYSQSGDECLSVARESDTTDARPLGERVAEELLAAGAKRLLRN
ncbi:MAG: hydroxymethylbilane synthase [Bdellovibrionales bacterium]|nr:hydroxymethylbilane synthase [Bdellovibrionales bacterium]